MFRALHTLKGGAGIVEFPVMETTMHAAEEVLTEARDGTQPLTPARINECLTCLDRVSGWLDVIERTGELPRETESQSTRTAEGAAPQPPAAWLGDILKKHARVAAHALTVVRFAPAADSLYHGEDPLQRMLSLPGLLALDLATREPWPPLDGLDPFRCNLVLIALSAVAGADLQAHLQGLTGECALVQLTVPSGEADSALPPRVLEIIEAQQALLAEGSPQTFAGRVGSAGMAAANALRFCGRPALAASLSRATEQSLLARSADPLQHALAQLFATEAVVPSAAQAESAAAPEVVARTFRIDAGQVDALVRLAGEPPSSTTPSAM